MKSYGWKQEKMQKLEFHISPLADIGAIINTGLRPMSHVTHYFSES
jgi:hypothetical protein